MKKNRVVSNKEWIEARKNLLEKEKLFTRMRDQLSRDRRALPSYHTVPKAALSLDAL